MRELWRHRDFRWLLVGQTLSMFGDTALFLAMAVWARVLTGSASAGGLVFLALALPALAGPAYGLLVDRFRRRRLMVVVDLASAAVVLLLLLVGSQRTVWVIYLVAFLYGGSLALFQSARSALVHALLPVELLDAGNAALTTVREALRLVGPVTGAGLYVAVGGGATAVLDAATFVASAGCLLAVRVPEPRPQPHEHHLRAELLAGARHLAADTVLRRVLLVLVAAWAVTGFSESTVFQVVALGLGRPPAFLGVVSLVQGIGAIVGGLTATWLCRRIGEPALVGLGLAAAAAGSLLLAGHGPAIVLPGVGLFGTALPWVAVGFLTALQRRTPASLQGRAYSAADTALTVPQTLSIAVGAALVAVVDYRLLLVAMAVVYVGGSAVLLRSRAAAVLSGPTASPSRP